MADTARQAPPKPTDDATGGGTGGAARARRTRGDLRRWAAGLLDQQLWCWGRDVARPEGNVLLDAGMCRHRPAGQERGGTLYQATLEGGAGVWLWGFGLLYREPGLGCVFLRRHGFDPVLVERPPERPVHRPEQLGPLARPANALQSATTRALLQGAAGWVAGYEHWVAESLGLDYRRTVLEARGEAPTVPAAAMASSWGRLASKSFRLSVPQEVVGVWGRLLASLRFAADTPVPSPAARPGGRRPSGVPDPYRIPGAKQWRRGTRTRGPT